MATVVLAASLLAAPSALAQQQHVWSGAADFHSGTALDTNVTSTGALVLARAEAPAYWLKSPSNPILTPSQSWDSGWALEPDVLYESGLYKMWYGGCISITECSIGYATSSDGLAWTPYAGNPVLTANVSSWDANLGAARVIHDGSVYRMWYAGNGPSGIKIGYAVSPDGIAWTKGGTQPVFSGTMAWDSGSVATPALFKSGSTFIMYFSGAAAGTYDYSTGLATSTDGVNWTEYPGNPVMVPTEAWEGTRVHPSWFSYNASGYSLYYTAGTPGTPAMIGHATSPDGVTWTKDPQNPVLTPGAPASWDGWSVAHPCVVDVGGQPRMYFSGYYQNGSTLILQIGYATWTPGGLAYLSAGSWISPVFDSGNANTTWTELSWTATTPPNTDLGASVEVGSTPTPDSSWVLSSPSLTSPVSLNLPKARYALVIVGLATGDGSQTPTLSSVALTYETPGPPPPSGNGLLIGGLGTFGLVLLIVLAGAAIALAVALLAVRGPRSRVPTPPPPGGLRCPRCGSAAQAGNSFCVRCGSPLSPPPGGPPGT